VGSGRSLRFLPETDPASEFRIKIEPGAGVKFSVFTAAGL